MEPSRARGLPGGAKTAPDRFGNITTQSRGRHQGCAERRSLPWIHTEKNVNFDIRMDGHIIDCIYNLYASDHFY